MSKKDSRPVGLQREQPHRRRLRWWLIPLILIVALIVALGVWLGGPRIRRALQPRPTLPPAAQEQEGAPGVLYQTDFENEAQFADWEQFDDGFISATISDGQLIVAVNALTDTGGWSGLNLTFDDFVLDVDATKLAGPDDNAIIVIFRLTDSENYNRFDISSDGFYAVSRVRDGVPEIVSDWNTSPAIRTGEATNHIRVIAVGDTFRFEVNDTPLLLCVNPDPEVRPLWDTTTDPPTCLGGEVTDTWQDGDLLRGRIGLGAQGYVGFDGENPTPAVATIGFDNVVIRSPDAEEPGP